MERWEIDIFIDRLCGFWPGTSVARNTVKESWASSDILKESKVSIAKEVLEEAKALNGFPTLGTVEFMFRKKMPVEDRPHCDICNNTLWVDAGSIVESGYTYTQVRKCQCYIQMRGGRQ